MSGLAGPSAGGEGEDDDSDEGGGLSCDMSCCLLARVCARVCVMKPGGGVQLPPWSEARGDADVRSRAPKELPGADFRCCCGGGGGGWVISMSRGGVLFGAGGLYWPFLARCSLTSASDRLPLTVVPAMDAGGLWSLCRSGMGFLFLTGDSGLGAFLTGCPVGDCLGGCVCCAAGLDC